MITLTEGQFILLDLIAIFILLFIGTCLVDNHANNKKVTLSQWIFTTLFAILAIIQISNHFILDLRLDKPTVTTSTTFIYDGKNANDSTITQLKHSKTDYYNINRTHYAPTDTRLASILRQPVTLHNEIILTTQKNSNQDFPIQKTTINGKGTIVSKLVLTTHKHIYKSHWFIFTLIEKTYDLTADTQ